MVMGVNSGRLWKSTRKRLRAVERRNPYKYKNVGSFNLLPTFFAENVDFLFAAGKALNNYGSVKTGSYISIN